MKVSVLQSVAMSEIFQVITISQVSCSPLTHPVSCFRLSLTQYHVLAGVGPAQERQRPRPRVGGELGHEALSPGRGERVGGHGGARP